MSRLFQDVQARSCVMWRARADGQANYAAYTAKYAPKFSDAFHEELLNDDADGNSTAASVLRWPCSSGRHVVKLRVTLLHTNGRSSRETSRALASGLPCAAVCGTLQTF